MLVNSDLEIVRFICKTEKLAGKSRNSWGLKPKFDQKKTMFQSIDPYTGKVIAKYEPHTREQVAEVICKSHEAFKVWKQKDITERASFLKQLAQILKSEKAGFAELITREMGKIIRESEAEIEKCAGLCEYYAEHGPRMLETQSAPSDGTVSYLRYDPLGVIFAIMPWNFPFWQVLRFAVPTILSGNAVVLKHAPNVFGSALAIQNLFRAAGFPEHLFASLIIPVELTEFVIGRPEIKGVTLTGSQRAGREVAALAGKYLKKTVLELGGSDPFIVLKDADMKEACRIGTASRMLNAGQVCIAAKRFIVEADILDEFIELFQKNLNDLKLGDPSDKTTDIGPMARPDLLEAIDEQVNSSIEQGAIVICGGEIINKKLYAPTLLHNVKKGMAVFDEETFGPVATITVVKNPEEAIRIANDTEFGLGASIWTRDLELAETMAGQLEAGSVFINGMVKSDPRLPFGGTKQSGYGRELAQFGIREFVNIKTVWFK